MNFSIIGSGNIAHYFGERCLAAGHFITEIISTNNQTGRALADKLQSTFLSNYEESKGDTFLLAIPDDAIRALAQSNFFNEKKVIHTSGSIGLKDIASMSEHIACLWPIFSIQKEKLPTRNDVPFVMQYSNQAVRRKAVSLIKCITNHVTEATDEQKAILHLTAVLVNNFSNHLFAKGERLLQEHKLDFDMLLPIIQDTVEKLSLASPALLQTGPASRGDQGTLDTHLNLITDEHLRTIYQTLSRSIAEFEA